MPLVPAEHCKWRFRRMLDEDGTHQFIMGAATRFDSVVQASFSAYVQLRHHEVTSRSGRREESSTWGVLLTPRRDGKRPWDTSSIRVQGDLQLSEEELKLDWSRAVIDSSHVRAARRGPKADPARSTAPGRAASTTSSPTPKASRSKCR